MTRNKQGATRPIKPAHPGDWPRGSQHVLRDQREERAEIRRQEIRHTIKQLGRLALAGELEV